MDSQDDHDHRPADARDRVDDLVRARRELNYLAEALASPAESSDRLAATLGVLHPAAAAVLSPAELLAVAALAVQTKRLQRD